jgi:diguanylate cyclase (GGDEF)-like protein/PAS domain S-box-containing protein
MAAGTKVKEKTPRPEAARGVVRPDLTELGRTLLHGYPGPIALIDAGGQAYAVNEKATTLAAALSGPLRPQAIPLVARSAEAGAAQSNLLRLGGDRSSLSIDLTVIPMGPAGSEGLTYLALGRDATLDRNLREALIESRRRYKDLVECSTDFVWETDREGNFAFVTARGALGFAPDRLIGKPARSLIDRRRPQPDPFPFEAREPCQDIEVWLRDAKGEPACLIASSLPMLSPEGDWQGARGVCRDVTETRRRDEALAVVRGREQLLAAMVKTIRDEVETGQMLESAGTAVMSALNGSACWVYRPDHGNRLIRAGSYGKMVVSPEEADIAIRAAIAADRDPELPGVAALASPTRYRNRLNGAICVTRIDRRRWTGDDRILLAGVADQLGIAFEQSDARERLVELARTDSLTGLLNRRALMQELETRLEALKRVGGAAALLYVDLDNFKAINDTQGHGRGDEALRALAALLVGFVGARGVTGRLGGDEFLLWLDRMPPANLPEEAGALLAAGKPLLALSARPDLPLTFSIGAVSIDAATAPQLDEILTRADAAMYEVKRAGKGRYTVVRATGATAAS